MSLTPKQLKAARAWMGWSLDDLVSRSGVNKNSIYRYENSRSDLSHDNKAKILGTFEAHRIKFTDNGLQEVTHTVQSLEGDDAYARLLDEIYSQTAKGNEVLFFYGKDSVTPPECIEREKRLRDKGVKFRFLVEEGDTYLRYPLEEYRYIAKEHYSHAPFLVFGEFTAFSNKEGNEIQIAWLPHLTAALTGLFNASWEHGSMPTQSTAESRYA
ncbi:helix-turn-helix domain-containing protein [Cerasicoccus fimbriatus]|uniref:helix-turn-helix domain-containing protein n=1 Tax=Cerasicoccus fimbriatus TaxID=3014554 RepID=UPI0022B5B59B|nr:helix-turn-helix transcriptional regulator [Cerasicoccus sp. TK19100]